MTPAAISALTSVLGSGGNGGGGSKPALGINLGMNLLKGVFGAVQTAKANKNINRLLNNPVTYKRPEEYAQELSYRQQQASQSEPLWAQQQKDNIGQATAQAYGAAREGAISSNTYMGAVGDIYSKKLNAYQDLTMQSQQWQEKQKENYMSTLQKGAGYSDAEWYENQLRPWETAMNRYQSQKQSGMANLFGGVEGMATATNNYMGTRYAQDILQGLQGTGIGQSDKVWNNPNQSFSKPIVNPTLGSSNSINSTLNNILKGIPVNQPQDYYTYNND